jgi:LysR family transcriptional regulator, benzoate and cis,cis-muconate-responsive activator of ben and cat genes
MELRHLRYFVAVAELQNITRAAAKLHVSQPPLSRQIRDLEDELGVALFQRSAKALRLTDAGRAFLSEARAALQRVDDAVQMAKIVGTGQRGEIHVGYAPSLAVELLPRALKYFHETSPGVQVRLHDLSTQEMLPGLVDGQLQVALLESLSIKVTTGLSFEELQRYPFAWPYIRRIRWRAGAKSAWNKSPRNVCLRSRFPTIPIITQSLTACLRR